MKPIALRCAALVFGVAIIGLMSACRHGKLEPRGYSGHEPNPDMAKARAAYPSLTGTPLEDCRLCHRSETRPMPINSCDGCHSLPKGQGARASLNAFGSAYLDGGRTEAALRAMDAEDSDGDGIPNGREIRARSFPGEADMVPGMPPAPSRILESSELHGLKRHTQFLLMNATKHFDSYASYEGWKIADLLEYLGVKDYSGITVYSWDGYRKDFPRDAVMRRYPDGTFDPPEDSTECPTWVHYPSLPPRGLAPGDKIPDALYLILADRRDGMPLEPFGIIPGKGKEGEGPFRLIVPQQVLSPPDQPQKENRPGCPRPFDPATDHNAGECIRGVAAIQIHPLPEGTIEPDWLAEGKRLLSEGKLLVFGNISQRRVQ